MYEVGDPVVLESTPVGPSGGQAVVTGATLTITFPDGTTSTPTVNRVGTLYRAQIVATQAGMHRFRWLYAGTDAQASQDLFTVTENTSLVSLDEALDHLRAIAVITTQAEKDKLVQFCRAATAACESYCRRPLTVRSFTQTTDSASSGPILLSYRPVTAISSVTESGTTVTSSGYQLDGRMGALYRGTSTAPGAWAAGRLNLVVTYLAGFANPPADLRLAVLREVEHLWQRTQNAPHGALEDGSFDEMMRDTSSALPWPVRSLLEPYVASGFA